jgi:hypothetical protein
MIVTSRRIIRNAQSGAAGNQTIWVTALIETKKIADQRAHSEPAKRPSPVIATIEPRIRWTQPQVETSAMITPPWPPTKTISSLRIPARPQRASSEPTISIRAPANTVQPVGCLSATLRLSALLLSMVLLSLVDDRGRP